MKMPWDDQTGLAKVAVVLAAITLVSLGLCGVNFGLFFVFKGGENSLLMVTAFVELAGILIGVGGLIVVGLIATVMVVVKGLGGDRQ